MSKSRKHSSRTAAEWLVWAEGEGCVGLAEKAPDSDAVPGTSVNITFIINIIFNGQFCYLLVGLCGYVGGGIYNWKDVVYRCVFCHTCHVRNFLNIS